MRTTDKWLLTGVVVLATGNFAFAQGGNSRGQQTAAERRAARTAERVAREPNPRHTGAARRDDHARRDERRAERDASPERDTSPRREHGRPEARLASRQFGRDVALRQHLAGVDRLRDEALLTGDQALLDRADAMESEIRARFAAIDTNSQGGGPQFGRFTTGDVQSPPAEEVQPLPAERREFERGLGRETARQVRGLEPFAEGEVELGAPGFGRRTAAERRYLRGREPSSKWDAQYWPMPQDPASQDPASQAPPPSDSQPLPAPETAPAGDTAPPTTDSSVP